MRIGYPCINNSIEYSTNNTFRLASYSEDKLIQTIDKNLESLLQILKFNLDNDILFFRIGSGIIPFASHEICKLNWRSHFKDKLAEIGLFIKQHNMRISMHPSQFVLINALNPKIVACSIAELNYHCNFLDALELDAKAKVQIHVGGVYGDKQAALNRFIANYKDLPGDIKKRLVIENDDRLFSTQNCLYIHSQVGIPIIFDNLHFYCLNDGESMIDAFLAARDTWNFDIDGIPMLDYSTQDLTSANIGKHTKTIDEEDFREFLSIIKDYDSDIMLEIKDKEKSTIIALDILQKVIF